MCRSRGRGRRVVVQKVDLDTALTALLLGVSSQDEIVRVRDQAAPEDLRDPAVLCIECGGSGQVHLGNFDHHNTEEDLPPACVQAYRAGFRPPCDDEALERLVAYVALLDTQGPEALRLRTETEEVREGEGTFPTLSDVFAGMLLGVPGSRTREQLLRGIEILQTVLERGLDPFGRMPSLEEWREYIEAKRRNDEAVREAVAGAKLFRTKRGRRAGFVETEVFGAIGALYERGCEIAVAYAPRFGDPPVPKYTIAGNGVRVDSLLPLLNGREPGWGGPAHGTIIGSPRTGSHLPPEEVLALVKEHL